MSNVDTVARSGRDESACLATDVPKQRIWAAILGNDQIHSSIFVKIT